jgi:hypothetical protein
VSEKLERVIRALEVTMIKMQGNFGTSRDASTALAHAAIAAMEERSYADRADGATTFDPELQSDADLDGAKT